MYKLGQEVTVFGKFAKVPVNGTMIADVETAVIEHGVTAISKKYEYEEFDAPKEGIVVGIRSIAHTRVHSPAETLGGDIICTTKTKRKGAYLVACDMRGLIYVPEDMVMDSDDDDLVELDDWDDEDDEEATL